MGKKTRKSSHRSSKKKVKQPYQPPAARDGVTSAPTATTTTTTTTTAGPAILQRLRPSADAKTRLAALAALLHTRFAPPPDATAPPPLPLPPPSNGKAATHASRSPASGGPADHTNNSLLPLLQAVRDQVCTGADLHCSIVAASCLGNYYSFYCCAPPSRVDSPLSDQVDAASAGWLLVYVARLKECLGHLAPNTQPVDIINDNDNSKNSNTKHDNAGGGGAQQHQQHPLWVELTDRCLYAMVHLLEGNPAAMDRLVTAPQESSSSSSSLTALGIDCLQVVTQLLRCSQDGLQTAVAPAPATTTKTSGSPQSIASTVWLGIQTLAARCLHSLVDDNPDLVIPFLTMEAPFSETLHAAVLLLSSTNVVAALHGAGACMAVYFTLPTTMTTTQIGAQTGAMRAHVAPCLRVVRQALAVGCRRGAELQSIVDRMVVAEQEREAEIADRALEREIVQHQNAKKEPAREIARRHSQRRKTVGDEDAAAAMEEEEEEEKEEALVAAAVPEPRAAASLARRRDATAALEEVYAEWHDAILRPLQVALELVVNWTSTQSAKDGDDRDDGDGDNDDDDDVIMQDEAPQLPPEFCANLLESDLPDTIYQLFLTFATWHRGLGKESPTTVRESISDVVCKAAVALGHCLANVPGWPAAAVQWNVLKQAANVECGDAVPEAVSSTMVVALRSRAAIRAQLGAADLEDVLSLLKSCSCRRPEVARDAVCMLGVLCSEAHSATVNESVCAALLLSSTPPADAASSNEQQHPSAMLLAEVLSVLMDMYGDDDCHPAVFGALGVLTHFQRTLPLLKQKVAIEQLTKNRSAEEIEQWKETAMNAARFIQYKKGHSS